MFRKLMDCVERKGSRRMAVRGILTNKRGILKTKKYTQDQKYTQNRVYSFHLSHKQSFGRQLHNLIS